MRELQNILADRELSRAITALYLEVDESIVNNLRSKVDAALRRAKAEGQEEGSAQWKKTNAEYERVSKAHSRLSETTDYLIRALDMAQPIVCSMLCPSVKKTGEEWSHVQKCDSISLTLRTAKSMYAGYARAAQIEAEG